jgi:hypothetical protein
MTQDEIIEMAREAGNFKSHALPEPWIPFFVAFAKLVAAKEREACAKVCESLSLEWEEQPDIAQAELATMLDCALAIRARGEA